MKLASKEVMFPMLLSLKIEEVSDERGPSFLAELSPREMSILLLALRFVPMLKSSSSPRFRAGLLV